MRGVRGVSCIYLLIYGLLDQLGITCPGYEPFEKKSCKTGEGGENRSVPEVSGIRQKTAKKVINFYTTSTCPRPPRYASKLNRAPIRQNPKC